MLHRWGRPVGQRRFMSFYPAGRLENTPPTSGKVVGKVCSSTPVFELFPCNSAHSLITLHSFVCTSKYLYVHVFPTFPGVLLESFCWMKTTDGVFCSSFHTLLLWNPFCVCPRSETAVLVHILGKPAAVLNKSFLGIKVFVGATEAAASSDIWPTLIVGGFSEIA